MFESAYTILKGKVDSWDMSKSLESEDTLGLRLADVTFTTPFILLLPIFELIENNLKIDRIKKSQDFRKNRHL